MSARSADMLSCSLPSVVESEKLSVASGDCSGSVSAVMQSMPSTEALPAMPRSRSMDCAWACPPSCPQARKNAMGNSDLWGNEAFGMAGLSEIALCDLPAPPKAFGVETFGCVFRIAYSRPAKIASSTLSSRRGRFISIRRQSESYSQFPSRILNPVRHRTNPPWRTSRSPSDESAVAGFPFAIGRIRHGGHPVRHRTNPPWRTFNPTGSSRRFPAG
jgi:hypothetical protein